MLGCNGFEISVWYPLREQPCLIRFTLSSFLSRDAIMPAYCTFTVQLPAYSGLASLYSDAPLSSSKNAVSICFVTLTSKIIMPLKGKGV
jgi:hypothetical protein